MLGDTGDRWQPSTSRSQREVRAASPTLAAYVDEEISEDVDQSHDEEGEFYRLPPIWACQTVRDSGIEGIPPEWEDTEGPR